MTKLQPADISAYIDAMRACGKSPAQIESAIARQRDWQPLCRMSTVGGRFKADVDLSKFSKAATAKLFKAVL